MILKTDQSLKVEYQLSTRLRKQFIQELEKNQTSTHGKCMAGMATWMLPEFTLHQKNNNCIQKAWYAI